jgi:hypothetical protein
MTPRERVMEVLKMPWRPDPDPYAPGRREFLLHEELEGRLEQAIAAAVEEEREACAKMIENCKWGGELAPLGDAICRELAAAIRARGEVKK